jgi:hypothetical protein
MVDSADRLQRALGPAIELGPQARAEANADPGRAASLAFLAQVMNMRGMANGETPMGFGLGAGFMEAAWRGEQKDPRTGKPTGPNPLDGFGSMIRGFVGTQIEFSDPYASIRRPEPRRPV